MNSSSRCSSSKLRILYIAYPLLPLSEHSAGGAEQVLWTLERTMHARGHSTAAAACDGSHVSGELFATGAPAEQLEQFHAREQEQSEKIVRWLRAGAASRFDFLHDMSGSFWRHGGEVPLPILATLHLPRSLYSGIDFSSVPEQVSFHCVSESQRTEFADLPRMLSVIRNGIALDRFPARLVPREKREYFLWLGRICEEKGTHTALDVAHAAGARLIVAGTVYPFLYHQKYFAREIIPRFKRGGSRVRHIDRPTFVEKVEVLANARALLITSEINETSSIVAMEAAACGTPVIALRRGALPEVVADRLTGLLADNAEEMIAALSRINEIDPEQCRRYAEEHYSAGRMADDYETLYRQMLTECSAMKQL
ncbi:MAG TPA: glycosyltransferase [Terriglobales bacterium]|nr:glycosyltransferase [Terriglobales bacterium]